MAREPTRKNPSTGHKVAPKNIGEAHRKARKVGAPPSPPSLWGGLTEGSTVLVDTAPWIYLLEDHPDFAPGFLGLFEAADRGQFRLALTTVTLAELLTGPFQAGKQTLATRYEKALSRYELVALTPAIASRAAQMRARYRLKLPDAVQLASALEIGAAALVTHDRDFSRVEGLPVLTGF